jgi:hypothetical protein
MESICYEYTTRFIRLAEYSCVVWLYILEVSVQS